MYCNKIIYNNFRNVESAVLELDKEVNVLNGFNAQGKTNLLEGIYLFACGKSFRGASDKELVKIGSGFGSVALNFTDKQRQRSFEMRFFENERKICLKEGIKVSKMSEFIGAFRAVLFSPDHLSIVKDGPAERRTFLDVALSQLYPAYVDALSKYKKLLSERNSLLKDPDVIGFNDIIGVISEQMARQAAFISAKRYDYVKRLGVHVKDIISDMTLGAEKCDLSYETPRDELEYKKLLSVNLEKEKAAKTTLYGAHKDDIAVKLNGLDSRVYASQGQQRSIALAMKIAEGEISKEISGEYPVFLFDDILSELDSKRKDFILSGLDGRQVIITGCEEINKGKIFKVSMGRVII